MQLTHLSFYRFFRLRNLNGLREELRSIGADFGLQGTILISQEGLNGMVTGELAGIERLRAWLEVVGVTEIKTHEAPEHAFHRLLIKIKREIISVGDPDLKPDLETAPRLAPAQLKEWLDEGRSFRLIDTRNAYEVEVGTFRGAEHWELDSSREFAARAAAIPSPDNDIPVVTFCTGGIRCEKASALLQKQGWQNVYQLDGGILGYFEDVGGAHFEGNCFVFDWRLAVDGALKPVPRSEDAAKQFGRHKPKV